ncbi:MAG: helicase [Desulfobulbaceae bacterium]|nr:helicase [Desulfobulbaceae bacterium]
MNYSDSRIELVKWVKDQLIGPAMQNEILHGISPIRRYPTGVLFPILQGDQGIDPASEIQEEENESPEDDSAGQSPASTTKPRRYIPPSSVGFSFFVRGEKIELQILCSAVRYEENTPELEGTREVAGGYVHDEEDHFVTTNTWKRIPLCSDAEGEARTFYEPDCGENRVCREAVQQRVENVLTGCADLDVLWRPYVDGWIVTVSLLNTYELPTEGSSKALDRERNKHSLFEVGLRCIPESGEIGTYPGVDKNLLNEEEQELELQYKHRHIYAVGHGAATNWVEENDKVKEIRTEFFPVVEVPQVTAEVGVTDAKTLQLAYLSSIVGSEQPIVADLERFVSDYETWITAQRSQANSTELDERVAASRIVDRMEVAVTRMKRGVKLLLGDSRAVQAFAYANQAMLDQMKQFDHVKGETKSQEDYCWRPFQLAFLLTVIESAVNEESDFRDTVDLIWFPTGGGKTEAYLGLIAFLIVWRRMTHPTSGGGTTVFMRYTLRLLTTQQYLRATRMICALELIRRATPTLGLGTEPITIGMWVGSATSPNTIEVAKKMVNKATDGTGAAPMGLVLDRCPWCGESFKAPESYVVLPNTFRFRCTNQHCPFGQTVQGYIPCNVVDEALYSEPPTLLIATIDKFARLAWEERASAFFGNHLNRPPELVIQDELHLIAGALGSVAGLYEAALDTVLVRKGVRPKYIASTATIRMAKQQVRRLYGKEVAVFPPPGLSCEDSYFASTVPLSVRPGRLYVGYLAPMLGRQPIGKIPSNIAPLAAALLVAPEAVFPIGTPDRDVLLEAWWTQVVYHGSLKGVGNTHNAFNSGVRDIVARYIGETEYANDGSESEISSIFERSSAPRIAQLTSFATAEDNAKTFSRLERPRKDLECLDAALATNMISVGLDVARLALMIVNGQPLTTAEYIQASSRVGRAKVPGIVFTNYYRDQARSLSHYENFRPFHEAFYRYVEPTSVVPYTYQARIRALHAALVIAVRHTVNHLLNNGQAKDFSPVSNDVCKTIEILKLRCRQADPERAEETEEHLDRLVSGWNSEVERCLTGKRQLNYQASDNDKLSDRLLYNHVDKIKGFWPTLQSMRNVEHTGLLKPL